MLFTVLIVPKRRLDNMGLIIFVQRFMKYLVGSSQWESSSFI